MNEPLPRSRRPMTVEMEAMGFHNARNAMTQRLLYYSTNRGVPQVPLDAALLQGQAADRGLYLPAEYPRLSSGQISALTGRPYRQVAFEILRRYTAAIIEDDTLGRLCDEAYDYEVPLEHVTGRCHVMRLDRGPTASFKDFAARMMARWMSVLMSADHGELIILTATSGDTGSAVAHAYNGIEGTRVVVLFPPDEVSDRQRRQMTTIGGNVTALAVEGQFDDCQRMVKQAFADPALSGIRLTSANSINIGRLLPQCVYYFYAYANLANARDAEPLVIAVPSGNFGNMMGAVIAGRMGLPLARLVVATNANDEVPLFVQTGMYHQIVPSRVCISNAMNVGHPSNLARLVDVYGGWMDETGTLRRSPDLSALRRDVYAVSVSDDDTRRTISGAYDRYGVILEPHGAVGWAGLGCALEQFPQYADHCCVSVETAHPAKFPEEIQASIGVTPEVPPALTGLEQLRESYHTISTQYEAFRDLLLEQFAN